MEPLQFTGSGELPEGYEESPSDYPRLITPEPEPVLEPEPRRKTDSELEREKWRKIHKGY